MLIRASAFKQGRWGEGGTGTLEPAPGTALHLLQAQRCSAITWVSFYRVHVEEQIPPFFFITLIYFWKGEGRTSGLTCFETTVGILLIKSSYKRASWWEKLKDCTKSKIRNQITYSLETFRKIKMKEWPLAKESAMLYQDLQKWLVSLTLLSVEGMVKLLLPQQNQQVLVGRWQHTGRRWVNKIVQLRLTNSPPGEFLLKWEIPVEIKPLKIKLTRYNPYSKFIYKNYTEPKRVKKIYRK